MNEWLVVAETPGGAGRTFGVTVIHRSQAAPDWQATEEETAAGMQVDVGDDWRALVTTLLHEAATVIGREPQSYNDVFIMGMAEQQKDNAVLEDAINDHLVTLFG